LAQDQPKVRARRRGVFAEYLARPFRRRAVSGLLAAETGADAGKLHLALEREVPRAARGAEFEQRFALP
jgi:hypothetical protein